MKILLSLLTFVIGIVLSLHLSMNSQVGEILKNAKMGNAFFWVIGAITAVAIGLTSWDATVFDRVKDVPVWLWTAGAMGAALVFGIAWLIPQVGAGTVFVVMIAGQVIAGMVFSHFGLLGSAVEPVNTMTIIGALFLIVGAAIVTYN